MLYDSGQIYGSLYIYRHIYVYIYMPKPTYGMNPCVGTRDAQNAEQDDFASQNPLRGPTVSSKLPRVGLCSGWTPDSKY